MADNILLSLLIVCTTFLILTLSDIHNKNQELDDMRIDAVRNGCAVFSQPDLKGITWNHEKPQVLPYTGRVR